MRLVAWDVARSPSGRARSGSEGTVSLLFRFKVGPTADCRRASPRPVKCPRPYRPPESVMTQPRDLSALRQIDPHAGKLRHKTREVRVGDRVVGGNNPVWVQSMTTTDTFDVEATIAQIKRL